MLLMHNVIDKFYPDKHLYSPLLASMQCLSAVTILGISIVANGTMEQVSFFCVVSLSDVLKAKRYIGLLFFFFFFTFFISILMR